MDVTPLISSDAQVIQSYKADGFKVSGQHYPDAVLVAIDGSQLWEETKGKSVTDLTYEDFKPLYDNASQIDVVLLGTGAQIAFLPPELRMKLKQAGLAIESMDTGAACRTYNVLMAEGRRVVAALLKV